MTADGWDVGREIWRNLIECISDGVAVVGPAGTKVYVNEAFCQLVGFSRDELVGRQAPFGYWPPEEMDSIRSAFGKTLDGEFSDFELVFQHKNGRRFPVLVHPAQLRHEGKLIGYVATVKDITESHRTAQALQASEELWRSVAETPFDHVVTIDRNYRYTFVNHTAPGATQKALIGKGTPFDSVAPSCFEQMHKAFDGVMNSGKPGSYEAFFPKLDRWFSAAVGPIFKNGKVVGASILSRDVTSQRQAETALRQAQRMEALGRLAGGIAHDFNNLLAPIVGNTSLIQSGLDKDDPDRELLDDVLTAASRARDLITRILVFGREAPLERQAVAVPELAEEVVRLLKVGASATLKIETKFDLWCPPADGVPSEVYQIITNLCTNAVQALEPEGGTVLLTVDSAAPSSNSGELKFVRITVEDTGPGIAEELRAKVFEPFFTTRSVGEGTGLGLSIVQAITSRCGGQVELGTREGGGARVVVYLPALSDAISVRPQSVRPDGIGTEQALRLVCVDDETLVLRLMRRVLERAGHTVACFDEPELAYHYIRDHISEVDCVLTDESMPVLTGTELARRLFELACELPIYILSGDVGKLPESLPENVWEKLQKPVNPATLRSVAAKIPRRRSAGD